MNSDKNYAIILEAMVRETEEEQDDTQCIFTKMERNTDNIFSPKQITKRAPKTGKKIHQSFINFNKAIDKK